MTNYSGTLNPGQQLNVDDTLTSPSGQYQLILQGDGNMVLYRLFDHCATWSTGTAGKSSQDARMQTDGNFVLVDTSNNALWSSGTDGNDGANIRLQDDGNLVLSLNDIALWTSQTAQTILYPGQQLNVGDTLYSPGGACYLVLQGDGNLVLYQTSPNQAIWATGTEGKSSQFAAMQGDGNFVIYDNSGNALWSTGTDGNNNAFLTVLDQGCVNINCQDYVIWQSEAGSGSGQSVPGSVATTVQVLQTIQVVTTEVGVTETTAGVVAEVVIVLT